MEEARIIKLISQTESRQEGFRMVVEHYQRKLYWHIRKMVIDHGDTDDILQEVFIKVWDHLEDFRNDSNLYTWLYRIATNECLNFLKKKKRRYYLSLSNVSSELIHKIDHSPYISGSEIQIRLQKSLLKLPDKQRLVFNMKYFEDMSYDDISRITGTSVGSLKASYHLAVKKIEKYIQSD